MRKAETRARDRNVYTLRGISLNALVTNFLPFLLLLLWNGSAISADRGSVTATDRLVRIVQAEHQALIAVFQDLDETRKSATAPEASHSEDEFTVPDRHLPFPVSLALPLTVIGHEFGRDGPAA